jgi:hypothetical protein
VGEEDEPGEAPVCSIGMLMFNSGNVTLSGLPSGNPSLSHQDIETFDAHSFQCEEVGL